MGLRGIGASRIRRTKAADKPADKIIAPLPWHKAGLDRPGRVKAFLEYLPITKGKVAGAKMKLLPE